MKSIRKLLCGVMMLFCLSSSSIYAMERANHLVWMQTAKNNIIDEAGTSNLTNARLSLEPGQRFGFNYNNQPNTFKASVWKYNGGGGYSLDRVRMENNRFDPFSTGSMIGYGWANNKALVWSLQANLHLLNYLPYTSDVDGIFGNRTHNAIVSFQQRNGLAADGIVGANTWAKLTWLEPLNGQRNVYDEDNTSFLENNPYQYVEDPNAQIINGSVTVSISEIEKYINIDELTDIKIND